ncbi:hypothetical protein [Lacinutrix chionoecetis]
MKKILLLTFIVATFNTILGQKKDNYFIGNWITEPNPNGMINLISLNEDGTGITGPGVNRNGEIKLSEFMKSDLQDWSVKKDTLTLTTKPIPRGNGKEPESMTLLYLIFEKEKDSFSAYYSDPIMDKMMKEAGEEVSPIKLEFKRLK